MAAAADINAAIAAIIARDTNMAAAKGLLPATIPKCRAKSKAKKGPCRAKGLRSSKRLP